jgi:DNA-binding transcriptional ArsR family regulator
MKTLRLSDKTVSKAMAALRNAGLIQEVRQGQGKANQIFLMLVDSAIEEKTTNSKENILDFQNRNISDSRHGDITVLDTENFRANQTKENKNNINYMLYPSISHILAGVKPLTNSSDIEAVQHFVKHILDAAYDCISLFEKNHPAEQFHPEVTPLVEAVGDALCDTICLHCPSIITIGSDTYSRLTVRLTLIKTEPYHILQILRIINKGRLLKDIKHLKKYLLTSLFMAIRSDRPML